MKNIAFKRAKNTQAKDNLHPDFIVEYADTDLFEKGFHKFEDGYEILDEESFKVELAKNEPNRLKFEETLKLRELSKQKAVEEANKEELLQERKDKREYEEFLKWKLMKNK